MYVRIGLNDVTLSGRRKAIRDRVRLITVGLVALLILGFALERHASRSWGGEVYGPTHGILDDTGPWPVIALGFIVFLQFVAHRTRMVVAILVAVGSLGLTIITAGGFLIEHLLSHVHRNAAGATLMPLTFGAVMVASVVQIVVEPWLAGLERQAIEYPQPDLPSAVIVRS